MLLQLPPALVDLRVLLVEREAVPEHLTDVSQEVFVARILENIKINYMCVLIGHISQTK